MTGPAAAQPQRVQNGRRRFGPAIRAPRALLAGALDAAGLLRWGWGTRGRLIAFNYHRIRPDDPSFSTPFSDDVFGPSVSVFEQQVAWLKNNTRLLSEADLLDIMRGGRFPAEECSLITFDDGYADNFALALPVLKRLNAPAIFFVPTALIESRRLGWWDTIAWILKRNERPEIRVNGNVWRTGNRERLIELFYEKMKREPAQNTRDFVPRLAEACGVEPAGPALQTNQLMTWNQIRALSDAGMGVGSHSHTHTVLATLDGEGQRRELAESKAVLEARTGRQVRTVAYPVGGREHFTAETTRLAEECGYEAAFSFATGTNRWPRMNRYAIARVSAPVNLPLAVAKARMPVLFATK